ncbi:hypothetical protein S349_31 [Shewanella sp. phage 3/49]|uniref:tail completion or Neck1 protein n=1 Tax=Shewanella sp. phage 3/49 TaxID=1458863 RepID=UPI0004F619C4|nr:tail completion or Neck1 protein [Shewanella sp. phage 3/49]AHK11821.1 hypothetical protein S349_31 [Shewanella sp. phage 3/49]
MGFAKRMQDTATRLLNKFDESECRIKLVRKGSSYFDEILGEEVFAADVLVPLVGVTVEYSASQVNGTTIQSGDFLALVTSAETPKFDDKIQVDGVQWSIVGEPKVDYTGTVILYKIHCRK